MKLSYIVDNEMKDICRLDTESVQSLKKQFHILHCIFKTNVSVFLGTCLIASSLRLIHTKPQHSFLRIHLNNFKMLVQPKQHSL